MGAWDRDRTFLVLQGLEEVLGGLLLGQRLSLLFSALVALDLFGQTLKFLDLLVDGGHQVLYAVCFE